MPIWMIILITSLVCGVVARPLDTLTNSKFLQYVLFFVVYYVTYNWLVRVSLEWISNHPVTLSKPERLSCIRVAAPTEATVRALLAYLPTTGYRIEEVDLSIGRIVMSDKWCIYPIYISPSDGGSRLEIG